ncbi:TPM domain-containing protein [Schaalia sp. 19OD2882]|uniref:TPM domain-containing protein n=1 Tax=Schaalia sp. 19OD2882 TaxID=2794089 RepID=UPI001C1EFB11|nr:TPM domain-containing protein [Schaalia sp. 19OD2882]QWW19770.1 TPM domain-containing protein [Schaalia sp. 19OD2882]
MNRRTTITSGGGRMRAWVRATLVTFVVAAWVLLATPWAHASTDHVIDEVDALTDQEEQALEQQILTVRKTYGEDVVILFAELEGKTPAARADDYFDDNGFGMGPQRSGILMLVAPTTRDVWFSTRGDSIQTFTDKGISVLYEELKPDLGDSNWGEAATLFVQECDRYMKAADQGHPVDKARTTLESLVASWFMAGVPGVLLGFIGSRGVVKGFFVSKMRNEGIVTTARSYVNSPAFQLIGQEDVLVGTHVTSMPKPPPSSSYSGSSGGSTTHVSSSGATHGGGGGKF